MTPSWKCYVLIKQCEFFSHTAYKPTPNDRWTIAWGHTDGVKEGDICTTSQGSAWLIDDVAESAHAVATHVAVPLTQNQFDALTSLAFNIGVTAFEESHLLVLLNDGQIEAAAAEFLKWDHQAGQVLEGLLTRREREKALFLAP